MSNESEAESRVRWERSPTYPFISLRKAVERVRAMYERHKREPTRLITVAPTWGYGAKSSGLQQTVGALKQYGLLEDSGSGEDRKIQITELARRILVDQRPGAQEQALQEAALKPRLIQEYAKWFEDRPSDDHCISELVFDRGFNGDAARVFLRSFVDTVEYANLAKRDTISSSPPAMAVIEEAPLMPAATMEQDTRSAGAASSSVASIPLARRMEVKMGAEALSVSAVLISPAEVDRLIRILEANKLLLLAAEDLM